MLSKNCTVNQRADSVAASLKSSAVAPILLAAVLLLAAGMYGAWRVHRLHERGNDILSENVASIRVAEQIVSTANELRHRLKRSVSSGNQRHLQDARALQLTAGEAIGDARELAKDDQEQQLVTQMQNGFEAVDEALDGLPASPTAEQLDQLATNLADEVIPAYIVARAEKFIEINERHLDRSRRHNAATANRLMLGLLMLGAGGGVFGLLSGYGIARLVDQKVVQLAIPVRDAAGELSQVVGPVSLSAKPGLDDLESILRRVSDQVTTVVRRLQDSERDRLRAEQLAAIGQLAAGLAHELRNPLTSVKAILQLAPTPSSLTDRDLEVLREESDRLDSAVRSLLDYARPPRLQKVDTDLPALIEQTSSLVDRRAQRKGVQLTVVAEPRDLSLPADPGQMRQVLLNLLLNAIDATPRGGSVKLECGREGPDTAEADDALTPISSAEHRRVVIRVTDTGCGLPEELGDRVFDPFITTKETGVGLGLSICRRIVSGHGGHISAHNPRGGGAVVEVRLPAATDDPDARKAPESLRRPSDNGNLIPRDA